MREIHNEGTPSATAAAAKNPRRRRRVIGTGGGAGCRPEVVRRYMARLCGEGTLPTDQKRARSKRAASTMSCTPYQITSRALSLTFARLERLTPPLLEDTSSTRRPVLGAGGQRPTARCALGRKFFWSNGLVRQSVGKAWWHSRSADGARLAVG